MINVVPIQQGDAEHHLNLNVSLQNILPQSKDICTHLLQLNNGNVAQPTKKRMLLTQEVACPSGQIKKCVIIVLSDQECQILIIHRDVPLNVTMACQIDDKSLTYKDTNSQSCEFLHCFLQSITMVDCDYFEACFKEEAGAYYVLNGPFKVGNSEVIFAKMVIELLSRNRNIHKIFVIQNVAIIPRFRRIL